MKRNIVILLIIIFLLIVCFTHTNKIDDNVIYIPNFLNKSDYEKILNLDKNKDDFIFENFRYSKPLNDKEVYNIFYDKEYIRRIQEKINPKIYPSEFPIEHRFYPSDSPGMQWHKDLLMYEKPQYEGIFTIRNTSKSVTEWVDKDDKTQSLWTEPNSLLIVKAQGYPHHVTPLVKGNREILKLIYTQTHKTNESYDEEMKRFKNE